MKSTVKEVLFEWWCYRISFIDSKLHNSRFYCASAADNRTRLDFHGEPRIWNGRFMKQTIKGNSALYVFVDEVLYIIVRSLGESN